MSVVTQARTVAPPTRAETRSRRRAERRRIPGSRIGYVYVLPFFLVFLAFSIYPWLDTAWVSLHDTRLSTYNHSNWVGLDNYRNLFSNHFFWNAFRNTLTIGIISTVPQLCMALGIAHLLNYRLRGRTFFRVAILMPYATSLAAATVIFTELFAPHLGIINWALHAVHLPQVDWQASMPDPTVDRTVPDEDVLRVRAVGRLKKKADFRMHLLIYVLVNAALVVIWALTGSGFFWPAFVIVGWGIGVVANAADAYIVTTPTEQQIADEMERLRRR